MTTLEQWVQFLEIEHGISPEVWQKRGLKFDDNYLYIPIYNQDGSLAYTKTRQNPDFKGSNKYLNASGCPITLYPIDVIETTDEIVLCEGELDALTLESHGIAAITSTGGALGFKKEFAEYFKGKRAYICFDTDSQGKQGAERTAKILLEAGIDVKIIDLPDEEGGSEDGQN